MFAVYNISEPQIDEQRTELIISTNASTIYNTARPNYTNYSSNNLSVDFANTTVKNEQSNYENMLLFIATSPENNSIVRLVILLLGKSKMVLP